MADHIFSDLLTGLMSPIKLTHFTSAKKFHGNRVKAKPPAKTQAARLKPRADRTNQYPDHRERNSAAEAVFAREFLYPGNETESRSDSTLDDQAGQTQKYMGALPRSVVETLLATSLPAAPLAPASAALAARRSKLRLYEAAQECSRQPAPSLQRPRAGIDSKSLVEVLGKIWMDSGMKQAIMAQ
jgi:hypothetical protein